MDDLIGKLAYKKRGFFSGIYGRIEKGDPYKIVFLDGSGVVFSRLDEIVVIHDEPHDISRTNNPKTRHQSNK